MVIFPVPKWRILRSRSRQKSAKRSARLRLLQLRRRCLPSKFDHDFACPSCGKARLGPGRYFASLCGPNITQPLYNILKIAFKSLLSCCLKRKNGVKYMLNGVIKLKNKRVTSHTEHRFFLLSPFACIHCFRNKYAYLPVRDRYYFCSRIYDFYSQTYCEL